MSAEMAAETTVGSMKSQGNAAVLALFDMTALGTEHGCIESAPIEKENALLACGASLPKGFHEWSGQHRIGIPPKSFATHVHNVHDGKFSAIYAMSELYHAVFAGPNVSNRLKRWGCGTEYASSLGQHGTIDCYVPAVITRGLLLLVGRFVFLVDHH